MSDPETSNERERESDRIAERSGPLGPASLPPDSDPAKSDAGKSATSKNLTAEEQMALYEQVVKENDWGHQPC
jgi:hypothetical protein